MASSLGPPPPLRKLGNDTRVAIFVDFDGTLVDLAPGPDEIAIPEGLTAALEGLAASLDGRVAVVSGRSIHDLCGFLGPACIYVAGSHGGEVRDPAGESLTAGTWSFDPADLEGLRNFVAERPGSLIEAKSMGVAVHYRKAPDLEVEVVDYAARIAASRSLELKRGKFVVELVAPGTDKGKAVDLLMQTSVFAGALPIFLGDDVTDEDGFAAAGRHGGYAIAVGERPADRAHYRLDDPRAVREWLFAKC